ncbi:MAG: TPM domain-containing protein [bacterium]|nr:TPM domain-containing protein [bacterium]
MANDKRSNKPRKFFTTDEQQAIVEAIKKAELRTSGEIRCHIERDVPKKKPAAGDPYLRARQVFEKLGMHATDLRNGVLVYLAVRSRQFAIVGDEELHKKVGDTFWRGIAGEMTDRFKRDDFAGGMSGGILSIGESLSEHFPYQSDDVNELPDDISFEN